MQGVASNDRSASMNDNQQERLMTIADLAWMVGIPVDTLYGWRHRGLGPRGYRVGRHVRYRRSTVEAWLSEQADRREDAG
jgi:excisionase family DNA binding protein